MPCGHARVPMLNPTDTAPPEDPQGFLRMPYSSRATHDGDGATGDITRTTVVVPPTHMQWVRISLHCAPQTC